MSSRELRKILRILNYPRLVSLENFRRPNFALVAQVLHWLVHRLEPNAEVPLEIGNEEARVKFIKSIAQLLVIKVGLKISMKKLYSADGHAVQELLKICNFMYRASQVTKQDDENENENADEKESLSESKIISKINELRKSRNLALELSQRGERLNQLLEKELSMREQRMFVLSRNLSHSDVDSFLREAIKSVEFDMTKLTDRIENVASDESNLDLKIEKRKEDLERYQKRLTALKSVRPAFMDEYEKLEQELVNLYDLYVLKFRCVAFLEQQLEDVEKSEMNQIKDREARISTMIEGMKESSSAIGNEDKLGFTGSGDEEEEEETSAAASNDEQQEVSKSKVQNATASVRKLSARGKLLQSMDGKQADSLDSDLDIGGDDEEDDSELDSEDELELMNLAKQGSGTKKEPVKADTMSDDDF